MNVLLSYYSNQQCSGAQTDAPEGQDVKIVIILMCRGLGTQPPGTRGSAILIRKLPKTINSSKEVSII